MLLEELTATSQAVSETSSRKAKIERLADMLRRLEPGEVAVGVAYLSGELRQRQIGVGYRSLRDLPAPAEAATLTVAEVDAACCESRLCEDTMRKWLCVSPHGSSH